MSIKSDRQLVFTSKNISVPALQFTWVSRPTIYEYGESAVNQSGFTAPKTIGGFTLKWKFLGSDRKNRRTNNTKPDDSESVWKMKNDPSSKEINLNMMTIMNLIRESKMKRVKKADLLKVFLKNRWSKRIEEDSACLSENKVAELIYNSGKELNLKYDWDAWISEEDLADGTELYSVIHNCQSTLVEAAKLSVFFESLLTNNQSMLTTVVASTMHNIQPRAGHNIKDLTAMNMWYERLDKMYNFSLGSAILGLLKTDNLTQLMSLNLPYLGEFEAKINELGVGNISSLFGKKQKSSILPIVEANFP